jgi:tetratricopeptide (TPR) repeat protein
MNEIQTRLYRLGRFYNQTSQYKRASHILAALVAAMPNNALAHYQLGFAFLQQFSRRREAVHHFRQAAHLCPQLLIAWYFLGWTLVRIENDFDSARQVVDELNQIHPNQAKRLSHLIDLNVVAR